jgi:hypothetical protein
MPGRDGELFKDRIEVTLDGRQIFYLFFGGAVIACMVFVLGVMVGRRIEARESATTEPADPAHDPLAALDQLEIRSSPELAFPAALRGDGNKTPLGAVDATLAATPADKPKPPEKSEEKSEEKSTTAAVSAMTSDDREATSPVPVPAPPGVKAKSEVKADAPAAPAAEVVADEAASPPAPPLASPSSYRRFRPVPRPRPSSRRSRRPGILRTSWKPTSRTRGAGTGSGSAATQRTPTRSRPRPNSKVVSGSLRT